jgi:hypothetical protein
MIVSGAKASLFLSIVGIDLIELSLLDDRIKSDYSLQKSLVESSRSCDWYSTRVV